jgi:16S rRNA (guanine527-N7)-methyltransferase
VTEEEACSWISERYGEDRLGKLESFVKILLAENGQQNLISKASEAQIWVRHILDSAQLDRLAEGADTWLDVGSGPGLPGIVLACLSERPILMVEPRRRRVEFLERAIEALELPHARVRQAEVQRMTGDRFEAVTARAYAPLPQIFKSTVQLTTPSTIWVLPKGRTAERELDEARQSWQGVFHVERSLTDADARIIVARDVRQKVKT